MAVGRQANFLKQARRRALSRGEESFPEIVTLEEAAKWLRCKCVTTLRNWISERKFTMADGLRQIGGEYRIHFPTLQARVTAGTFMQRAVTQSAKGSRPRRNGHGNPVAVSMAGPLNQRRPRGMGDPPNVNGALWLVDQVVVVSKADDGGDQE